MNKQLVKQEIEKIIEDLHKRIGGKNARRQYEPSKTRIAKLEELGVLDCMPEGFGNSDAKAVIEAIENKQIYVNFDAVDEFETPLQKAINKSEPVEETPAGKIVARTLVDSDDNVIKIPGSTPVEIIENHIAMYNDAQSKEAKDQQRTCKHEWEYGNSYFLPKSFVAKYGKDARDCTCKKCGLRQIRTRRSARR